MPSRGATRRRGPEERKAGGGAPAGGGGAGRRAGPDTEERVAAPALAALDRLEQVRRAAVVEPQEGAHRRLQVGVAGGPEEDRVGVARQAPALAEAERARHRHLRGPPGIKTAFRPTGTKGRAFRGATRLRHPASRGLSLADGPSRGRSVLP